MPAGRKTRRHILANSDIAELLAAEVEDAKMPLQKALRRASRRAFLWPEEVAEMLRKKIPLTELPGVGPYLSKQIRRWIEDPPAVPEPPAIRRNFFTLPQARAALQKRPEWAGNLKGDLQMHTLWSEGSGSIEEMGLEAEA